MIGVKICWIIFKALILLIVGLIVISIALIVSIAHVLMGAITDGLAWLSDRIFIFQLLHAIAWVITELLFWIKGGLLFLVDTFKKL